MNRDTDSICRKLLETRGPREVSEWINEGDNTLGELDRAKSLSLADEIYKAGAAHVYAIEIEEHPEGSSTGKLIVELPDDLAARQRVLAWAGKIASQQGFGDDPDTDTGQRYVFSMLD